MPKELTTTRTQIFCIALPPLEPLKLLSGLFEPTRSKTFLIHWDKITRKRQPTTPIAIQTPIISTMPRSHPWTSLDHSVRPLPRLRIDRRGEGKIGWYRRQAEQGCKVVRLTDRAGKNLEPAPLIIPRTFLSPLGHPRKQAYAEGHPL